MKMFIPPLGTELVITETWSPTIEHERRNMGLIQAVALNKTVDPCSGEYLCDTCNVYGSWRCPQCKHYVGTNVAKSVVPFLSGIILIPDRYYIRKNCKEFDSVTFRIKSSNKTIDKKRFWVKLSDLDSLNVELANAGS